MNWKTILIKLGIGLAITAVMVLINVASLLRVIWEFREIDVMFNGQYTSVSMWTVMTNKQLAAAVDFPYFDNVKKIFTYLGMAAGIIISLKLSKLLLTHKLDTIKLKNKFKIEKEIEDQKQERLVKEIGKIWKK